MSSIIKKTIKAFIPYGVIAFHIKHLKNKKLRQIKQLEPIEKFQIEVHVVEHCNLNCVGCLHFSPLAEEKYLDPKNFEADCARLSQLTKELTEIKLLGGEPLLHPKITIFFDIARKYFKNTLIKLTTNGVLLKKQSNEFWNNCNKNRVVISISDYPIHIDINTIEHLAEKYQVYIMYNESFCKTSTRVKIKMEKRPLDLFGEQNIKESFFNCPNKINYNCTTLRDGKIYHCATVAHIQHFNQYFKQKLEVSENNYIDIYKINSKQEILDFLIKPIPFCRYCKIKAMQFDIEYGISKKEITEWV